MKSIRFLFYFLQLTALALFTRCDNSTEGEIIDETIVGSNVIVSEYRATSPFNGILIKNFGNLFISQSYEPSLKIEADDNIIKNVVTAVENNILTVGLGSKSYSNVTLHIYASIPVIEKLMIEGAGNIVVEKPIACDNLTCGINGAGNITLRGTGVNATFTINGAGNINAFDFFTEKCYALVNGAGNCDVNASRELTAIITGTGKITYSGNPPTVNSSISGLGKISKR